MAYAISYDTYKELLKAGQKYVTAAQAADPEWQAWQQIASSNAWDEPDPPSPTKDYWAEYMGTLSPEVATAFQQHMADSESWADKLTPIMSMIPIAVAGVGLAGAVGLLGAEVGAAGSTAVADAGVITTFDTGVGGLFGSEAAITAASDVAFGAGGITSSTVLSSFGATSILPAGLGFGEGMTLSTLAASSGLSLADAAAKVVDAAKASAPVAKTLFDSIGGVGGLINAGLGVAGAVTAAQAAKDQAEEEQRTAEYNAREAEAAARNALLRGEEEARSVRRAGSVLEGTQRAAYGASGVVIGEGTPRKTVEQTAFFTQEDIGTVRKNAADEAATYRRQGSRFNAQAGYINPSATGTKTLIGGLATVASRWYDRYGG